MFIKKGYYSSLEAYLDCFIMKMIDCICPLRPLNCSKETYCTPIPNYKNN